MKHTFSTLLMIVFLLTACVPTGTPAPASSPTPEIILTPTNTPIPTPQPDMLYVNPGQSLGKISPLIYGSNYGPWLSVSLDMLPKAYDSGVTILRFPAGSWGDHNNVTKLQIDQFMDFANKVGAEAIFTARLLVGTPEQAADMVRYTNIEKKYNVEYWSIGNEPTLYQSEVKKFGETYDTARFNKEWREYALAMKAVDPSIKLVGAEINQFSYSLEQGATTNYGEWDETWFVDFLKANGDLVDVVSFHRYPFPKSSVSGPPSVVELSQNAQEWDKIIIHARELIHQYTGRDLPIAITEFNSAYDKSVGGEATPDSHMNAIWSADVLGRMIKNGVFMANYWSLAAKGGYGGLGLVGQSDAYPSYYTYQMYKMFGDELVYSSSEDPYLSIYAARNSDGFLTLMVVNLSSEVKEKVISIENQPLAKGEAWLFDPSHKAEDMGNVELNNGKVLFPAQSVTLFVVK